MEPKSLDNTPSYVPNGKRLWYELLQSAIAASPPQSMNVAQLATLRPTDSTPISNRPTVRSVNIRSINKDGLSFCSDKRAAKAQILSQVPEAELHFWLPQVYLQMRLSGKLRINKDEKMRQEWWSSLRPHEKLWFAWPTPAAPRDEAALAAAKPSEDISDDFAILTLDVDFVDVSLLAPSPFARELHILRVNEWCIQAVNP
ncbi:Pyridoxine/pyridoxamine 5'-phosphate oxidase [Gracilariopsis chorda]|uniref:Pyridoxine/pyridoxamine 5'-phosphate oxidase n=1 Tax=Gracilariopsis chorda TaxID=448386 RepID=A0A2V3II53_9FLOR|nr:Pyridoxine/pyridoxamine 5'-phosphate oxidase [Gracilariopsis chorda]|eukprot:PXF41718.1 Pyridoxine/pyridoxamine 5'-phosphate oxidase [Gracilariopsis chorda]